MSDVPSQYRLAYDEQRIAARVAELGGEMTSWAIAARQATGQDVLCVCVLRGAVMFFSDVLRQITTSVEPAFCRTWSYSSESNAQLKGVRVSVDDIEATGRAILMVDDICDSGATLARLHDVFQGLGAADVRAAVCVRRVVDEPKFTPTWSGFEYSGDDWFVGYGMEDANRYANLSAIYTIAERL